MKSNICVGFYQNTYGEICAYSSYDEENEKHQKLVENIERFAKSTNCLLEYILDGFGDFSDFNQQNYGYQSIGLVMEERTEDLGYNLIVHFEVEGFCVDYYFDNMNEYAKELFVPMKAITDEKAKEYESSLCELLKGRNKNVW